MQIKTMPITRNAWVQKDGIYRKEFVSNGTTAREWVDIFGYQSIHDTAQEILCSKDFKVTNNVTYKVAILPGRHSCFNYANYVDWATISATAKGQKLIELPSREVACLIADALTGEELQEDMGIEWLALVHKPADEFWNQSKCHYVLGMYPLQVYKLTAFPIKAFEPWAIYTGAFAYIEAI